MTRDKAIEVLIEAAIELLHLPLTADSNPDQGEFDKRIREAIETIRET